MPLLGVDMASGKTLYAIHRRLSLLTSSSRCKTVTTTLLICTEAVTNGQLTGVVVTDVEKCHGVVRPASGGEVCNLPHPPEHTPTRQDSTVKKRKKHR